MAPVENPPQAWLERRFAGLTPGDFEEGVRFYSGANLQAPEGLAEAWGTLGPGGEIMQPVQQEELREYKALVVVGSPNDKTHMQTLLGFVAVIDVLGFDAPPMFWLPHTVAPELRTEDDAVDLVKTFFSEHSVDLGLDGIVPGEPAGLRLALTLRSRIHKSVQLSRTLGDIVNERRQNAHKAQRLRECLHCLLWDYARTRLACGIPPVDPELPEGRLQQLGSYVVGDLLGRGMCGKVYKVWAGAPGGSEQVVKFMEKSTVRDIQDLRVFKRSIEVMKLLSSERWRHPNVVQLYQVYHSPTYICLRMEFSGPEDLFRRLRRAGGEVRETKEGQQGQEAQAKAKEPLGPTKTATIMRQMLAVLRHLHTGPQIVHRDIKPENFIVRETEGDVVIKLADFDLAQVHQPGAMCRIACGTLPFAAPEVLLQPEFDPFAADIWSLGVVLLEIFCGVRVLERVLELPKPEDSRAVRHSPGVAVPRKVREALEQPGSARALLEAHCQPELTELQPVIARMIDGMLTVTPADRWKADDLWV